MPRNIYLRAPIVVVATFASVHGIAWLIREIYWVINDLDNWALDIWNNPSKPLIYAIIAGMVYLIVAKVVKK